MGFGGMNSIIFSDYNNVDDTQTDRMRILAYFYIIGMKNPWLDSQHQAIQHYILRYKRTDRLSKYAIQAMLF